PKILASTSNKAFTSMVWSEAINSSVTVFTLSLIEEALMYSFKSALVVFKLKVLPILSGIFSFQAILTSGRSSLERYMFMFFKNLKFELLGLFKLSTKERSIISSTKSLRVLFTSKVLVELVSISGVKTLKGKLSPDDEGITTVSL